MVYRHVNIVLKNDKFSFVLFGTEYKYTTLNECENAIDNAWIWFFE